MSKITIRLVGPNGEPFEEWTPEMKQEFRNMIHEAMVSFRGVALMASEMEGDPDLELDDEMMEWPVVDLYDLWRAGFVGEFVYDELKDVLE